MSWSSPDGAIEQARSAIERWVDLQEGDSDATGAGVRDAAFALVEAFHQLDGWLSSGGRLPEAWSTKMQGGVGGTISRCPACGSPLANESDYDGVHCRYCRPRRSTAPPPSGPSGDVHTEGDMAGSGGHRNYFEDVVAWHRAFGVPVGAAPDANLPAERVALRRTIMAEEWEELNAAMDARDIVEIADACADLVVTVLGTAAEYGLPFDAVWREVDRSNWAKAGPDGEVYRRPDGKITKPPDWQPPDIAGVLGMGAEPTTGQSEGWESKNTRREEGLT